MSGKPNDRPTVPIPINLSGAEIGAVQTTIFGKKSKVGTVNAQRSTEKSYVALCALS